jgi:CheY-like chemotaxis protein
MPSDQQSPSASPGQVVVLLADDEVAIRNIMRLALEAEGYFVLAASDGTEALTLARDYPGSIHVLVSDIEMPTLDGLGLRERILKERPTTTP